MLNRSVLRYGCEDISIELLKQVLQWAKTGRFFSYQNEHNYLTGLRGVETPILLMGGLSEDLLSFIKPLCSYFSNSVLYEGEWDLFPLLEVKVMPEGRHTFLEKLLAFS